MITDRERERERDRRSKQVARICASKGKCAIRRVMALNAKSLAESVTQALERQGTRGLGFSLQEGGPMMMEHFKTFVDM